jgi:hypothetical protein
LIAAGHAFSGHYDGDGDILFEYACRLGCEGIEIRILPRQR